METITLEKDIRVFYVTADSFPAGILAAHEKLHSIVPFPKDRRFFGLSRPENNQGIVYKAATEEISPNEAEKYHCDTLLIKKGNYRSMTLNDYAKDPQSIERTFKKILESPNLDPRGYCVEWYLNDNKTVRCMVRIANS